jgi:hypothetical protein
MNKEQYQLLITKPEIPIELWYEFFLEKGGANIGLEAFVDIFTNMLMGVSIVSKTGPKWVSLETALRKFYGHYNKKFGL